MLEEQTFSVGDHVVKSKGDYQCSGHVVAVFSKLDGKTRVVVEMIEIPGLLHIFAPSQLVHADKPQADPSCVACDYGYPASACSSGCKCGSC